MNYQIEKTDNKNDTCTRYNSYEVKNGTLIQITNKYEGIPQNLAINVVCYIILISLFIFIRKKAWNYGKLAWLNKSKTSILSGRDSRQGDFDDHLSIADQKLLHEEKRKSFVDKIWSVIPLFIKMSDEQLHRRSGPDAVIYCQFQRSLMFTVAVMTFFSLVVILPCNLSGTLLGNVTTFAGSTIGNLPNNNPVLWAHFTISLCLMLFGFYLSTRFLATIDFKSLAEFSSSILIKNIPVNSCDEIAIQTHFREAYSSVSVQNVQVVFKVDKLVRIHNEKKAAEEALNFCFKQLDSGGDQIMVVPHECGRFLACQCCKGQKCIPVDGVEFYKAEVIRLTNMFIEEKSNAIHDLKLPLAFVTFEDIKQALLVRRDYIYQNYLCFNKIPSRSSTVSKELKSSQWKVVFAPKSDDILWENLHMRGWKYWSIIILVNAVVAFIVIFLSTPSVILTIVDKLNISQNVVKYKLVGGSSKLSQIVAQFAPSFILVIVNSLMPVLVYWSDQLSYHWTKSSQNMAVMNKLYMILLTTVLILPSLGLTSVVELIKWLFPETSEFPSKFRWQCIFLPDGGSLFCNYLISASFIGTSLELLRFGELFIFACKLLFSKSRAEDHNIAKKVVWDFQFGLNYAWTLAMFTVTSAYAVIVPLITPFGLTYLCLKHLVDRYNLVHVNNYSVVHNSVHTNAAQLMQIGLILTQATVLIFVTIRQASVSALPICCLLAFLLGLVLQFGRTIRRWIKSMSFMKYSLPNPYSSTDDHEAQGVGIVSENEDFMFVDELKNDAFIPMQLVPEVAGDNVEELLSRISRGSMTGSAGSPHRRSYGSQS